MIQAARSMFKTIRRSPYQAFLAILMTTLSFFVAYCFVYILTIASTALSYLETRPQVIGYFAIDAAPGLLDEARIALEQKSYVASVKTVTKQQALELFKAANAKDPLLTELVTAEILPASIEVSANDITSLSTIRDDLSSISGIEEVVYQKDVVENLARWTRTVRQTGIFITGVLFCITLLLVSVMLGLRIAMKRKEIGILRLLGASMWYIRGPFVLEGVMYGVLGSIIGLTLATTLLLYLTPEIVAFFGDIRVMPLPLEFHALLLGAGVLVGTMLGIISSTLAVKRFVRGR